jgi:hypothetical protein
MYSSEDMKMLLKMIESGLLKLDDSSGVSVVGKFGLGEWQKVFDIASMNAQMGQLVLLTP